MTEAAGFVPCLEAVLPDVPAALADDMARGRIVAAGARLPREFAFQTFGLECPLGSPAPTADLLVSAVARRHGAAALAAGARWRPQWTFLAALAAAMTAGSPAIDDVWLEFDLEGSQPDVPNLFCRPIHPTGDADALCAGAAAAVALLTGAPPDRALAAAIAAAAAALPPQAAVFQIGAMRARPGAGVRLCVREISLDGIIGLLAAIGYGDVAGVEALLVSFQNAVGDVTLAVDLGPDLGPKIGLECYFAPSRRGLAPDEMMSRFLARIEAGGLCTREKAVALQTFPGVSQGDANLPLGRRARYRRSVHHIKLVHRAGAAPEAKAYLAFQPQPPR